MRAAAAIPRAADGVRRAASGLLGPRTLRSRVGRPRRVARAILVAAAVALTLGATYMIWFRDSSFVSVQRVTVTGLHGVNAARERSAVTAAAKGMTTLHFDAAALRRALGAGLTVDAVRVSVHFPHAMRIQVVEKPPVAILVDGSQRVAVGSGGIVLPDVHPAPGSLPPLDVGALPQVRLSDARALRLVAAAAAAPAALRARVIRLRELPDKGLVADLEHGPEVLLGSPTQLEAKWTAAAAILADGTSRGATFIDVRLPDRPVADTLHVAPGPPIDYAAPIPVPLQSPTGTPTTGAGVTGAGTTGAGAAGTTGTGAAGAGATGATGTTVPATGSHP